MKLSDLVNKKMTVFCGHFGSGKTNIAVNAAISAKQHSKSVCIVDLDIVNPYFRTADNQELLESLGIRSMLPKYANSNIEMPTLPDGYSNVFSSDEHIIVDVGGNPEGSVILSCDRDKYLKSGYEMYFVVNFFRPSTPDAGAALSLMREIEANSGLAFCGIVNNSNIGAETADGDLISTVDMCGELSELSNIKTVAMTSVIDLQNDIYPIVKIENITKKIY